MNLMTSDDYQLLGDSKYRAYVGQVEKALKGFEYTSEWADLISALTKLNKILASHKYAIIPKRMTIGKRLAQCMHPALPAGVHLKAIEVYETVFKLIGSDKLADELYVYSSGLFPLMANAASNVRPALLKIYEVYFLPLGDRLKCATTGLLLGILPGLEEGSESYQWSNDLLEQLSVAVGQAHFYGSLWTCLLTSHSVRLPATAFLLAHYDRKCSLDDQLHVMGSSIDVVVRALQECVQDSQVLVQRNALDFVALAFPFHGHHLTKADQKRVLSASLSALMRRDMSLNRRLFSWILGDNSTTGADIVTSSGVKGGGHDEGSKAALDYLSAHSCSPLVEVLNEIILAPAGDTSSADGSYPPRATAPEPSAAVPVRILISLLDKQEIGSLVLEDVLVSVFRILRSACHQQSSRAGADGGITSRPGFYEHALRLTQVVDTIRMRFPMVGGNVIALASSAPPSRRPSPSTPCTCTLPSQQPQPLQPQPYVPKEASADIIKSVTLLLGNIETSFLWSFVSDLLCSLLRRSWVPPTSPDRGSLPTLVSSSMAGSLGFVEACELVEVVLHVLCPEGGGRSASNIATHSEHVSVLLRDILVTVEESCRAALGAGTCLSPGQLRELLGALQLCSNLLATTVPTLPLGAAAFVDSYSSTDSCTGDQPCETGDKRTPCDTRSRPSELGVMSQCTAIYLDLFPTIVSTCCAGYREPELMTYQAICDPQLTKISCGSSESYLQADIAMLACKLLVDFSSIPLYCSSVQKALLTSSGMSSDPAAKRAHPDWLLWLLTLVFRCDQFSVSSVALCSLLDLGSLAHLATEQLASGDTEAQSRLHHRHPESAGGHGNRGGSPSATVPTAGSADAGPATNEAGRVFILLWPALTPALYKHVFGDGFLYGQITRLVWSRIGPSVPEAFQTSISCAILNHLLQLVPNETIVEDVIATSLVAVDSGQRVAAYEKLFSFWHCTQSLCKTGARSLNRPLLVALMAMASEDEAVRLLVRDWLMHVLEEDGGVLRLVEPLLIALLHPDTARVEIRRLEIIGAAASDAQHENSSQMFVDQSSALLDERRIYAISHEGGSVKYHVMDVKTASQRFPPRTQAVVKSAVTAVDKDGITTSKSSLSPEANFQHVRQDSVKLHLNPFGSESSLDELIFDGFRPHTSIHSASSCKEVNPGSSATVVEEKPSSYDDIIARAKRLDSETCKREGIRFGLDDDEDDFDSYDNSVGSEPPDEAAVLAKGLVEDVLAAVFDIVDHKSLPSAPLSHSVDMPRSCSRPSSMAVDSVDGVSCSSPPIAAAAGTPCIPGPPSSPKSVPTASKSEPATAPAAIDSNKATAGLPSQAGVTYGYGGKPGVRSLDPTAPMMLGAEKLVQSLHIAIYTQAYDSSRVLCVLHCLKALLAVSPPLVLRALTLHSIGSLPHAAALVKELMQRHKRCLSCGGGSGVASGFYATIPTSADAATSDAAVAAASIGETTLLEAFAGLAAVFSRSYFTDLKTRTSGDDDGVEVDGVRRRWPTALPGLSATDVERNFAVQASALEVLCQLVAQSAACFGSLQTSAASPRDPTMLRVSELIAKEHLHWVVLGLVHSFAFWTDEHWSRLGIKWRLSEQLLVHHRTVQLASAIVAFEHCASARWRQEQNAGGGSGRQMLGHGRLRLCEREAFSRCLAAALEGCSGGPHAWHVQLTWLQMVIGCLPHFGSSLPGIVTEVVNRLCISIDSLLEPAWSTSVTRQQGSDSRRSSGQAIAGGGTALLPPPGHVARLLRLFAGLVHFMLADCCTQSPSTAMLAEGTLEPAATTGGGSSPLSLGSSTTTHLIAVLDPLAAMAPERTGGARFGEVESLPAAAQKRMLDQLPRVVTTMYRLWAATATATVAEDTAPEQLHVGRQELRTQILSLLSPVAAGGCIKHLLAAMVQVWNELRASGSFLKKFSQESVVVTVDQSTFIDLLMSIRVLHCDALVDSICKLLKVIAAEGDFPKVGTADCDSKWMLYAGAIHLLLCYAHKMGPMTTSNVTSFCTFIREVLQQSPPPVGVLLLLRLLATVVQKLSVIAGDSDRKMLKELQDVTQKLVEACCTIVASQLEPTAWLQTRKNYSVKAPASRQQQQAPGHTDSDDEDATSPAVAGSSASATLLLQPATAGLPDNGLPNDSARLTVAGSLEQYSVVALEHLAEILASLLDVVYPSEDKERAVPVLVSVFHHVLPYLRNHSAHNVPSYRACSQLLASVSSYGYTRRAWRRDALELLLAPEFFQMDRKSLSHWRVLTDHLMTQDKQAFKDLLARLTLSGAAALPLFGGGVKDQEFELRGQYMKRLAFVIFCSDVDQYKHNLPEIQERLAECLRLPHVPSLQAQVFLCLRVLLMRVSSQHLIALWPTIVTELVQVLLQIEQELNTDVEDSRSPPAGSSAQVTRLVALDMSWAHGNGLHAHSNPAWMQLYVSACRLLDLLCYLPDDRIPEFHHYLWMFISAGGDSIGQSKGFVPHAVRIERRMRELFGPCSSASGKGLLMADSPISSLRDLHSVFYALANQAHRRPQSRPLAVAERYVETDFLEAIPQQ